MHSLYGYCKVSYDGLRYRLAGVSRGIANAGIYTIFAQCMCNIFSVDVPRELCRKETHRGQIFYVSDPCCYYNPFSCPANSFDAVLCGFAIFLFPHLEQALSEFYRVLRPGGKLGITIASNSDALSQWYGKHLTEYHNLYHFPMNAGGTHLDYHSELPTYLAHAGFSDVQVLQEQTEVVYADAQQWWDAKWTHGTRYSLEHMSSEVLAHFKAEVFARLQEAREPDGIHEEWHFQFTVGIKRE
jgi:SAM-dependent methyltransferase